MSTRHSFKTEESTFLRLGLRSTFFGVQRGLNICSSRGGIVDIRIFITHTHTHTSLFHEQLLALTVRLYHLPLAPCHNKQARRFHSCWLSWHRWPEGDSRVYHSGGKREEDAELSNNSEVQIPIRPTLWGNIKVHWIVFSSRASLYNGSNSQNRNTKKENLGFILSKLREWGHLRAIAEPDVCTGGTKMN